MYSVIRGRLGFYSRPVGVLSKSEIILTRFPFSLSLSDIDGYRTLPLAFSVRCFKPRLTKPIAECQFPFKALLPKLDIASRSAS